MAASLVLAAMISFAAAATEIPVGHLGTVSQSDAAELYQLHTGLAPGQLAQPVAVTILGSRCAYASPYRDEYARKILRWEKWETTRTPGQECPR